MSRPGIEYRKRGISLWIIQGWKRQPVWKDGAQSRWPTSGERIWQQDCRPEASRCRGHRPATTRDEGSLIPACHRNRICRFPEQQSRRRARFY